MSNSAAHKERRRARAARKMRAARAHRGGIRFAMAAAALRVPARRDAFAQVVERLTNRQRMAWVQAKCPGKKERDPTAVLPFLGHRIAA